MKDYAEGALKPGGGLSSLWNLCLLSLTALSRSPVKIYKVPGGFGSKPCDAPPPLHNFLKFHAHRPELSSAYLDQANSGFLPGPGARLLTVCVSRNMVLKSPRGLTAPAFFPARWGLRIPRRVRPREWPRSPLPGCTPCLSQRPIVCVLRAPETPPVQRATQRAPAGQAAPAVQDPPSPA